MNDATVETVDFRIDEQARWHVARYFEHAVLLTSAATDRDIRAEIEQCRSYAIDFLHDLIRLNPALFTVVTIDRQVPK